MSGRKVKRKGVGGGYMGGWGRKRKEKMKKKRKEKKSGIREW